MYIPDEWVIVKITGTDPHYRVFGSWRGSYVSGDSWRMNSGIVSVTENEFEYEFHGHSGSIYKCNKKCYGINSPYNASVLGEYYSNSDGKMEAMPKMPDIMNMDWIIG